jgi:hypothetical protein
MSAARRFALVLTLALATVAMSASPGLAQLGAPNPSGGTSLRQTTEEGTGSVGLSDYLSSGLSIDLGLRSWLNSYAVSRFFVPAATRPVSGRTLTAAAPRRVWGR